MEKNNVERELFRSMRPSFIEEKKNAIKVKKRLVKNMIKLNNRSSKRERDKLNKLIQETKKEMSVLRKRIKKVQNAYV